MTDDLEGFDLDIYGNADTETTDMVSTRILKHQEKEKLRDAMKKEKAGDILQELPKPGETLHIISNGTFDYWTFVPIIIALMGGRSNEGWFSTWTLNRANCNELFEIYDRGDLGSINFLTGVYFKRREPAVYAKLITGIQERGGRYKALENHSKIILLTNGTDYITMEGSANFTANPRNEQNTITNLRSVYDFHRGWMDEILSKK